MLVVTFFSVFYMSWSPISSLSCWRRLLHSVVLACSTHKQLCVIHSDCKAIAHMIVYEQNSSIDLTRSARIELGRAIFDTMNSSYGWVNGWIAGQWSPCGESWQTWINNYKDLSAGENAQWFSAMAIHDRITAIETYHDLTTRHCSVVTSQLVPSSWVPYTHIRSP